MLIILLEVHQELNVDGAGGRGQRDGTWPVGVASWMGVARCHQSDHGGFLMCVDASRVTLIGILMMVLCQFSRSRVLLIMYLQEKVYISKEILLVSQVKCDHWKF